MTDPVAVALMTVVVIGIALMGALMASCWRARVIGRRRRESLHEYRQRKQ
ncbi:hypothetical protein [Celeribacter sp.]